MTAPKSLYLPVFVVSTANKKISYDSDSSEIFVSLLY